MDDIVQQLLERPSETSSEQLSLILRILEEKRKLKEEERRDKELQLEIVKAMTGVSQSQETTTGPINQIPVAAFRSPLPLEAALNAEPLTEDFGNLEDFLMSATFDDSTHGLITEFTEFTPDPAAVQHDFINPKDSAISMNFDPEAAAFAAEFLTDIAPDPLSLNSQLTDTGYITEKVSGITLEAEEAFPAWLQTPIANALPEADDSYPWLNPSSEPLYQEPLSAQLSARYMIQPQIPVLSRVPHALNEAITPPIPPDYPYPFIAYDGSSSSRSRSYRRGSSSSCKFPRIDSDYGEDNGIECSSPADVFRHAALRASTRKRTVEDQCVCVECREHIGMLFLRGTQPSFEAPYVVDVTCAQCAENGGDSIAKSDKHKSEASGRKRARVAPAVECEVCKRHIGSGGVRKAFAGEPGGDAGTEDWEEPSFNVELVCNPCGAKYLFCSECGGGGRHRTGKWRPRQLFVPGRRTCSLPHVRIGDATVQYRVIDVATELTEDALKGVQDVFFDCMISLYAIPTVIEARPGGYEDVRREVETYGRTVLDALMKDGDGTGDQKKQCKKYLTVAWIEKQHRNKGKGKQTPRDKIPWLARLALEGTVSPGSFSDVSRADAFPVTGKDQSVPDSNKTSVYVAFSITEWNIPLGILYTLQISPRSVFLPTASSYGELLRRGVERIQADARRDNLPQPEHLWCWTRADHARLTTIPERLGFQTKEMYLKKLKSTGGVGLVKDNWFDGSLLAGNMKEIVRGEAVRVYVMSVREFGKFPNKRRGR